MAAGQPTSYKKEYNEQARKLCLLGATDKVLADFFNVCERTINNWKEEHPEFLQSLRAGKLIADANVSEALYNRACGYSHPEEKVFNFQGEIITKNTTKHYPPDTAAAFTWLKNRQGDIWREKSELDIKDNRDKVEQSKLIMEALKNKSRK